ncbi:hypothetical protein [Campylobacter concisus]|uniref:Uncharacterized protein n=1 Tax=Campylobacter concisus TaxID=199 RepID=A0A1X0U3B1_9BACT|nr:hypothetical protein A3835_02305 [Campylobacter concisus]
MVKKIAFTLFLFFVGTNANASFLEALAKGIAQDMKEFMTPPKKPVCDPTFANSRSIYVRDSNGIGFDYEYTYKSLSIDSNLYVEDPTKTEYPNIQRIASINCSNNMMSTYLTLWYIDKTTGRIIEEFVPIESYEKELKKLPLLDINEAQERGWISADFRRNYYERNYSVIYLKDKKGK